MNADPTEPVYQTLTANPAVSLSSAYATLNDGQEPPYSTWKIRGDGEAKHNLDYMLFSDRGASAIEVGAGGYAIWYFFNNSGYPLAI